MELRDYVLILVRRWWIVAICLILGVVGLLAYTKGQKTVFQAVSSMNFVKNVEQVAVTAPNQFGYENFYALSSNELLAKLVNGWLAEPATASDIYAKASVPVPAQSLARYDRIIKTKPLPGASLSITTSADTAAQAEALAAATTGFVKERMNDLVTRGVLDQVEIISSKPLSQAQATSSGSAGLIGALTGLILGCILAFFVEYLVGPRTKR